MVQSSRVLASVTLLLLMHSLAVSAQSCLSGSSCLRSTCGKVTQNGRTYCCPCPSAGVLVINGQCQCRGGSVGGGGTFRPPPPPPPPSCSVASIRTRCGSAFDSCKASVLGGSATRLRELLSVPTLKQALTPRPTASGHQILPISHMPAALHSSLNLAQSASCNTANAQKCAEPGQQCVKEAGTDMTKMCACGQSIVNCIVAAGCEVPVNSCSSFSQLPGCSVTGCTGADTGTGTSTPPPPVNGCDTVALGKCTAAYGPCAQGAGTDNSKHCKCYEDIISCINAAKCPIPAGTCQGLKTFPQCNINACGMTATSPTPSVSPNPTGSCDAAAAATCSDTYTQCTTDAAGDAAKACTCMQTLSTCLKAASCPLPDTACTAAGTLDPACTVDGCASTAPQSKCPAGLTQCLSNLRGCIRSRYSSTVCNSLAYCKSYAATYASDCNTLQASSMCQGVTTPTNPNPSTTPVPTPTPEPTHVPIGDTRINNKAYIADRRKDNGCFGTLVFIGSIIVDFNYECEYELEAASTVRVFKTFKSSSSNYMATLTSTDVFAKQQRYVYRHSGNAVYSYPLLPSDGEWKGSVPSRTSTRWTEAGDLLQQKHYHQGTVTLTAEATGGATVLTNAAVSFYGPVFVITGTNAASKAVNYLGVITNYKTLNRCAGQCSLAAEVQIDNGPGSRSMYAAINFNTATNTLTMDFTEVIGTKIFSLTATPSTSSYSLHVSGVEDDQDPCNIEIAIMGSQAYTARWGCSSGGSNAYTIAISNVNGASAVATVGTTTTNIQVTGDQVAITPSDGPAISGVLWGSAGMSNAHPIGTKPEECSAMRTEFESCAASLATISTQKLATPIGTVNEVCKADGCLSKVKKYVLKCSSRYDSAASKAVADIQAFCAKDKSTGESCWAPAIAAKVDGCDFSGLPIDFESNTPPTFESWIRNEAPAWITSKRPAFCASQCAQKMSKTLTCLANSGELAYTGLSTAVAALSKILCNERGGDICLNSLRGLWMVNQADLQSLTSEQLTTLCSPCVNDLVTEMSRHVDTRNFAVGVSTVCLKDGDSFCWPKVNRIQAFFTGDDLDQNALANAPREVMDTMCEDRCFFRTMSRSMELTATKEEMKETLSIFGFLCIKDGNDYCLPKMTRATQTMGCAAGGPNGMPTMPSPTPGASMPTGGDCSSAALSRCQSAANSCVQGAGADMGKICTCSNQAIQCIKDASCPLPEGMCQSLSQIPGCQISECSSNAAPLPTSTSAPPSGTGSCDAQKVGTCSQTYSTCAQGAATDLGKQCDCGKTVISCIKDAGCPIPDGQCSAFSQLPGCEIAGCSGGSAPAQPTTAPPSGGSSGSCDASKIATCGQTAQTCVTGAGTDFGKICDCYKETLSCIKGAGCPVPDGTCQALSQIPNCKIDGCTRRLLQTPRGGGVAAAATVGLSLAKHLHRTAFAAKLNPTTPALNLFAAHGLDTVNHVRKSMHIQASKLRVTSLVEGLTLAQANCDAAKVAPCGQAAQTCMTGAGSDFGKICDCAKTLVSCVEGAGCPIPSDQCAGFEQLPGCTISGCTGAPGSGGAAATSAPNPTPVTSSCSTSDLSKCLSAYQPCAQAANTDLGAQCKCGQEYLACAKATGCPADPNQCSALASLPNCAVDCAAGSASGGGASATALPAGAISCPAECKSRVSSEIGQMGCCAGSMWDYFKKLSDDPSMVALVHRSFKACGADFEGAARCSSASIRKFRGSTRLRMRWSWVQKNLAKFKTEFAEDVANNLGIAVTDVTIISVSQGSTRRLLQTQETASEVVVTYEVSGDQTVADAAGKTELNLVETARSYEADTGAAITVEGTSGTISGGSGGSGGLSTPVLAGIIAGAVVVVAAIIGTVVVVVKKGSGGSSQKTTLPPASSSGGIVGATAPAAEPQYSAPTAPPPGTGPTHEVAL